MSTWVSDERGLWHPGYERVSLKNLSGKTIRIKQKDIDGKEFTQEVAAGADYIYEGPDRAALFDLWQIDKSGNTTTLGNDFRSNPEFLESYAKARNAFGFNTIDEYLQYLGYDEKKVREEFNKKAVRINQHELPQRVEEIKRLGGGDDRANPGKNVRYGGFGELPTV